MTIGQPAQSHFLRPLWAGHVLISATLLIVYLLTLLPGVGYTGDTAALQFVGKILGTAHETGYPTHILLNHLFASLIPFGSLAYKANLFSALASIVACSFLFRILCQLDIRWWVSCLTAITFGLTPTLWSQSVVAEVYSLNILFVSLVVYFFIKWHQAHDDRNFYAACAAYACSFGNHLTMITFLPAILYIVWRNRDRFPVDLRRILWVALIILLGVLPYLYFFWRTSSPETPYLGVRATDASSLWFYLTGGHFRTRLFSFSLETLAVERIPFYAGLLFREYHVLLALALVGLFTFRDRAVSSFLLLGYLGNTLFALNYGIPDVYIYFIPGYFVLAIYLALGLNTLCSRARGRVAVIGSIAVALMPAALCVLNWRSADQHENAKGAKTVEAVLDLVKRDALIVCPCYHYAEFFYYYLLGEGKQANNIYVVFYGVEMIPYASVHAYLAEGKPLPLPLQRITAPKNLTVYFYNGEYEVGSPSTFYIGPTDPVPFGQAVQQRIEQRKNQILAAGLKLTQIGDNFYGVHAFKSATFSLPSSRDSSPRKRP